MTFIAAGGDRGAGENRSRWMTRFEEDENEEGYCALLSSDDEALVERFIAWLVKHGITYELVNSARVDGIPDVMTVRLLDTRLAQRMKMTWGDLRER